VINGEIMLPGNDGDYDENNKTANKEQN